MTTDSSPPQVFSDPEGRYRITRSQPDEIVRHDISDEELTQLADLKGDYLWEAMWTALGLAAGFAPTAIAAISNAYFAEDPTPISGGELAQVVLCFCALVAFAIVGLIMTGKRGDARKLVRTIRDRTRKDVSGARRTTGRFRFAQLAAARHGYAHSDTNDS